MLSAGLLALWCRGIFAVDHVSYRFGHSSPPDPAAGQSWWVFHARSLNAMSFGGSVHFFFEEYQSFNDRRDMVWETSHRGVRRTSTPIEPLSGGGPWGIAQIRFGPGDWRILGAGLLHGARQGSEWWGVLVPVWGMLLALWTPWAIVTLRRRRRLRRLALGLCLKCGYDRSTLDSGQTCPECGTSSASSAA